MTTCESALAHEFQPRLANGVWIIGPDFFATDGEGKPLSPIASVFPKFRTVVTGRGIHAMQVEVMVDFLSRRLTEAGHEGLREIEEQVYQNAVSILVRSEILLIRSIPANMGQVFAADEMLQRLVEKNRIQFTGVHLAEVRRMLRLRGESWRISPSPRSPAEKANYIGSSRVHVKTGLTLYYNAPTGGRYLTCEEFRRIRPLFRGNRAEALARLREIVTLSRLVNNHGSRELSFFLPPGENLPIEPFEELVSVLERDESEATLLEAVALFDRISADYAERAGPELAADDIDCLSWRSTMFCRLSEINEEGVEEYALGLSPEFLLNVRWLPGARIYEGRILFERNADPRVKSLIFHFHHYRHLYQDAGETFAINVGRVESPLTERDSSGEEREVYLVVLGDAATGENIRLVRLMKYDVTHRLKRGIPKDLAIQETIRYRDYIFDRLRAAAELGCPITSYTEICFEEERPGLGVVPVYFFERKYVPGMVSDKIPPVRYELPGFMVRLARLLGRAAMVSMTLGRACPRTGRIFYDDGDEVIQFDTERLPERLVVIETTGSFNDWKTPMSATLPDCLVHLAAHLEKARDKETALPELAAAIETFIGALTEELAGMQNVLRARGTPLRQLFSNRDHEPDGIRERWEGILDRIEDTRPEDLKRLVDESPLLSAFRPAP